MMLSVLHIDAVGVTFNIVGESYVAVVLTCDYVSVTCRSVGDTFYIVSESYVADALTTDSVSFTYRSVNVELDGVNES